MAWRRTRGAGRYQGISRRQNVCGHGAHRPDHHSRYRERYTCRRARGAASTHGTTGIRSHVEQIEAVPRYFVLKPKHSGFFATTLDTPARSPPPPSSHSDRHRRQHLRALYNERPVHARAQDLRSCGLHRVEYNRRQRARAAADSDCAERQYCGFNTPHVSLTTRIHGSAAVYRHRSVAHRAFTGA